jgi:hypothetical protein
VAYEHARTCGDFAKQVTEQDDRPVSQSEAVYVVERLEVVEVQVYERVPFRVRMRECVREVLGDRVVPREPRQRVLIAYASMTFSMREWMSAIGARLVNESMSLG